MAYEAITSSISAQLVGRLFTYTQIIHHMTAKIGQVVDNFVDKGVAICWHVQVYFL
ncbi:MAG TPA: hypothetical protein VKR06_41075 [Ktedonosporobacter sp.]|nr:hypothetical protein [Ktedonosporobacter sp.]